MANCQFEMKNYSDAAVSYNSLLKIVNTPEIMAKHIIALIRNGNRNQATRTRTEMQGGRGWIPGTPRICSSPSGSGVTLESTTGGP